MITSVSNNRIKNVIRLSAKAKLRKEQKAYIVEGIRMFREAPRNKIKEIYMTEALCKKEKLTDCFSWKIPCELVSEEVFIKMSDTKTPQGILCVMEKPEYVFEEELSKKNGLWVVLEDMQDPGNLGTIFRTGEAAGVTGIVMTRQTVDIFNPKAVRSTAGSVYRVPFFYMEDTVWVLNQMKQHGITVYAAHLCGEQFYHQFDYTGATAFLIGNEGNGLKDQTAGGASKYLRIPMRGKVESLNAAMACGILMYEAHRQRSLS